MKIKNNNLSKFETKQELIFKNKNNNQNNTKTSFTNKQINYYAKQIYFNLLKTPDGSFINAKYIYPLRAEVLMFERMPIVMKINDQNKYIIYKKILKTNTKLQILQVIKKQLKIDIKYQTRQFKAANLKTFLEAASSANRTISLKTLLEKLIGKDWFSCT